MAPAGLGRRAAARRGPAATVAVQPVRPAGLRRARGGDRRAHPASSWRRWPGCPLGTASALEFLGPLGVAVARGRGGRLLWPALAAVGVVLLTEPWHGAIDLAGVAFALAAAACWAAYILLTQKVGDELTGLRGLAVSMPVAAIVASLVAGPSVVGHLTWELVAIGLGLAVLLPVIPFSLELLALRRLTVDAFGTLMSLEPAIALVVGLVVLGQVPGRGRAGRDRVRRRGGHRGTARRRAHVAGPRRGRTGASRLTEWRHRTSGTREHGRLRGHRGAVRRLRTCRPPGSGGRRPARGRAGRGARRRHPGRR